MKIVHLVPGIGEEASGPSYSVPRLCQALVACGDEVELKCLAAAGSVPGVRLTIHRQWPMTGRFAVSTDMAAAMRRASASADIVHNHSLWSMVNIAAGFAVPGHRAKLVASPRGTLSEWAFSGGSRWLKRLLWPLQARLLARADLLHATSDAEYADIRRLGFHAPVVLAANGVDVAAAATMKAPHDKRILLYLGRIHPTKGIENLLYAWRDLASQHPDWRLVIAGKGESAHVAAITDLARSLGAQRVDLPGPLYGDAKHAAYYNADLFVLPSHSENFGMVVAEALAHGCPAIVTHGAPWQGLETEHCGWWIDDDVRALAAALDRAMGLPQERLAAMGEQGRSWMQRDFDWSVIGRRMDTAYRWLLGDAAKPEWVRED